MLHYRIAFHFPRAAGERVVAEGLDLPDARLMIASAMEDLAPCLPEVGKPLPTPNPAVNTDADLFELVPLIIR
jgi:hypothetical protein